MHRLTTPGYAGGLRGGDDYINNAIAGTPAPADAALGAGTYTGSYFFAPTDQVTGAAINRGFKALSENTDFLDTSLVATSATLATAVATLATTVTTLNTAVSDLATLDAAYAAFVAALAASGTPGTSMVGAAAQYSGFLPAGTLDSQLALLGEYVGRQKGARVVTTTDSLTFDDSVVILSTTGGAYNVTLPNPSLNRGLKFYLAAKDGNDIETHNVTLFRYSTEKIDGIAASYVLDNANGRWILSSDGTDWYIWSC